MRSCWRTTRCVIRCCITEPGGEEVGGEHRQRGLDAQHAPPQRAGRETGAAEQRLIETTIGSSGSSHTESRSESSSSSVSFGADPAPAAGASPGMPGSPGNFNVAAVAGRWTLQMAGIECGIDLRDTKWMGDVYSIYPSNTCAPGVGPVRSWQPTPNGIGIRLNDSMGRSIGELWSYGPKRWKGKIGGEAAVMTR